MKKLAVIMLSLLSACIIVLLGCSNKKKPTEPSDKTMSFEWCDVPAGEYTYGEGDTIKAIDYDYQIMKYEVTNEQYVTYLQEALAAAEITVNDSTVKGYYPGDEQWPAGDYEFLDLNDDGCQIDWYDSSFAINQGYEDHPVVEVTWFAAWGFSNHYGWRIPNEYEWEKAARGNTGWDYPWGDNIDGSRANYWNSGDPWDEGTTPVGFYNGQHYEDFQTSDSPSPFGIYDMAGNVWDWTNSRQFEGSSDRIICGGSWHRPSMHLVSWYRWACQPDVSDYVTGFRCVRSP